jgi:hypothetical protein
VTTAGPSVEIITPQRKIIAGSCLTIYRARYGRPAPRRARRSPVDLDKTVVNAMIDGMAEQTIR